MEEGCPAGGGRARAAPYEAGPATRYGVRGPGGGTLGASPSGRSLRAQTLTPKSAAMPARPDA